jgi:hypothetical protein
MTATAKQFTAVVAKDGRRVFVAVPFDPDEVWGRKREHRVHGRIGGKGVRASIERVGDGWGFHLGPAWLRDCGVTPGEKYKVELAPEGPQRDDLAPDFAAALEAAPKAGEFFDALAQFYRKAYLRYIDATKRRPEERERRIAEVVTLCEAGIKERPKP